MNTTLTSLDYATPAEPVAESAPPRPRRARVVVRESYNGNIDLGNLIGGFPDLWAGASDPLSQRFGGFFPADRFTLPQQGPSGIVVEAEWRAVMLWCRWLVERNHLATGFNSVLVNFVGPMKVQFVLAGGSDLSPDDAEEHPLAKDAQAVWDEWSRLSEWGPANVSRLPGENGPDREKEARERIGKEGEVWLRLGAGGRDRDFLPWCRFLDPEFVRSPAGGFRPGADGDWKWGVCTDPDDAECELGYWLAYPDGRGEELEPSEVVRMKANVPRGVKRGISDFAPLEPYIHETLGLLSNVLTTSRSQSAIAWIEQYATATPDQIRRALATEADGYTATGWGTVAPPSYSGDGGGFGGSRALPVQRNPAGTVIHAGQNRQYAPGPVSQGVPSFQAAADMSLRAAGWRWHIPDWFTGGADSFAAALVTGSPFAAGIGSRQDDFRAFTARLAVAVLRFAEGSGRLPPGTSRRVMPVVTAQPVVIADEQKQASVNEFKLRNRLIDPQEIIKQDGRDPKLVARNIKAWEKEFPQPGQGGPGQPPPDGGTPAPAGTDPTPRPPGIAGGDGSGEMAEGSVQEAAPHKFASTQIDLTGEARERILAMARAVADADLGADGREENPHVTVRYGLHGGDPAPVADAARHTRPFAVTLGGVSLFAGAENRKPYDVIKVDVSGEDLRRLNDRLASLPHTDTHAVYRPHCTIAYVKAGLGAKYAAIFAPLNLRVEVDRFTFSDHDREFTEILLSGVRESWDESKHPRDGGKFSSKPGTSGGPATRSPGAGEDRPPATRRPAPPPEKVGRALVAARVRGDVARRRRVIAAVKREHELAAAIGGFNLPDSEPADVIHAVDAARKPRAFADGRELRDFLRRREVLVKEATNPKRPESVRAAARKALEAEPVHFLEVKTLLTSANSAVHMSAKAMARKERWADRYHATFSVVGFDDRRGAKHSGHRVHVWPHTLGQTLRLEHGERAESPAAVLRHLGAVSESSPGAGEAAGPGCVK